MSKQGKIAVTVILIIGFIFLSGLCMVAGVSRTFTILIAIGLYFGIAAMWKKPKDQNSKEIKLEKNQKSEDDKAIMK